VYRPTRSGHRRVPARNGTEAGFAKIGKFFDLITYPE
jgi:hypothetical protein